MRPHLTIFGYFGEQSFSNENQKALAAFFDVQYVIGQKPFHRSDLIALLSKTEILALTPRVGKQLDVTIFDVLPNIRCIVLPTTGTEWIDVEALQKKGLKVVNTPNYSTTACAEYTMGMLLTLSRHLHQAVLALHQQIQVPPGWDLAHKKMAIFGFGNVGQELARLASAFRMQVQYYDPYVEHQQYTKVTRIQDLLTDIDVLCLCSALTSETFEIFNSERLSFLSKPITIINTARPQLVDMTALVNCLGTSVQKYAVDIGYLDMSDYKSFLEHPDIIATPHYSWYTRESIMNGQKQWIQQIIEHGLG